ncbi:MAG: Hsp20/alpha crystallin family protein [Pseudohongiellaceae bacterium]
MSLINYEPMNFLNRMQNEMNQFFHRNGRSLMPALIDEDEAWLTSEWAPHVDIKEEENQFVVTADIPGVEPKDIEVSMDSGVLTIKGERSSEKEETKKDYRLKECSYGSFIRSFRMPESADSDNIKAKGKNGVLSLTIAKKETVKPRKISIES